MTTSVGLGSGTTSVGSGLGPGLGPGPGLGLGVLVGGTTTLQVWQGCDVHVSQSCLCVLSKRGKTYLDNGARAVDDGQGSGLSDGVLLVVELESGRLRAVRGVLGNNTGGGDNGTVLRGNKASGRGDEEKSVAGEHLEGYVCLFWVVL